MFRSFIRITVLLLVGLFASNSQVLAQDSPPDDEGITVTGYGLASAPAETGVLQIVVYGDDLYSGPPEVPEVEATPGTTARTSMEPVIAAIETHAFVESVTVVVPTPIGSLGQALPIARLDVTITAPTQEGLIALINDTARAASEDRMQIGFLGASFAVADCQVLEQQARQAAVDDAIRQAEVQAGINGIDLGDIISTTDVASIAISPSYYGFSIGTSSSCDSPKPMSTLGSFELSSTFVAFDPVKQLPVVEVYREIQVTFTTGESSATPAA